MLVLLVVDVVGLDDTDEETEVIVEVEVLLPLLLVVVVLDVVEKAVLVDIGSRTAVVKLVLVDVLVDGDELAEVTVLVLLLLVLLIVVVLLVVVAVLAEVGTVTFVVLEHCFRI